MRYVALCLVFLGGLGCADSSPTAPTASPPPQTLAITAPVDWVLTGDAVTLSASATFGDGAVRTVLPRWSVDDASLATVDANGRVLGRGAGVATIVATLEGVTASTRIRVIPDHRGVWAGTLRQTSCRHWDFRTCGRSYPSTSTFVLQLQLQQQKDNVRGMFDVALTYPAGALNQGTVHTTGTAHGSTGVDGTLAMDGDIVLNDRLIGTMFRWRSRIEDGVWRGGFSLLYPGAPGDLFPLVLEYDIVGLTRSP